MSFRASELIYNTDGTVFHLALHPEQLASTVFLVGDPGRVEKVSHFFDRVEHRVAKREFVTHTGYIGSRRLSVVSTGIGTDNIDIVLNELDILQNVDREKKELKSEFKPLTIIRLGTSGAFQKGIEPGSVVLSKFALGLDNLMHFYAAREVMATELLANFECFADEHFKLPVQPYAFQSDPELFLHFSGQFIQHGITLTLPGFYGPQGRQLRAPLYSDAIWNALPDFQWNKLRITNLEMESSGIYGLSRLLGHQALSINLILANRVKGTFLSDPGTAMSSMISKVLSNLPHELTT
ncbi:MAG: nucleoside phosphorylase [Saprospiraceae bacterium]|nr:nucleoside phosphorylase [Saprospiraceae bacterium]